MMSAASDHNIPTIPFSSQQDALHALNDICARMAFCYDTQSQLNNALANLNRTINELAQKKHEAKSAIVEFAETCPPCEPVRQEIESVAESAAALIADAEEVIRKARGEQS